MDACKYLAPKGLLIDEFVMDIKDYTSAVSDSASPAGFILFIQRKVNIKPVLQMMGIGETQFDAIISTGITPIVSQYRAHSVKCISSTTMLTAAGVSLHDHLDGVATLEEIYHELGDRIQYPTFYIGVTKRRWCSVGTEKVRRIQVQEFHEVMGGNEEYLLVHSDGIKTGDPFCFYMSDSKTALSSCDKVSDHFRCLKQDTEKRKVFGGVSFTCFGHPNIDSSPFLENFHGVGTYCYGEIGRGNLSLYEEGNEEGAVICSCQHVYSAAYLVMSYSSPP